MVEKEDWSDRLSASCQKAISQPIFRESAITHEMFTTKDQAFKVNVPNRSTWKIEVYSLNGTKNSEYKGKGDATIPFTKDMRSSGFSIVKFESEIQHCVKTIAVF